MVIKTSGRGDQLVLSNLTLRVRKSLFMVVTVQSVLPFVQCADWIVYIDIKGSLGSFIARYGSAGLHTGHGSSLSHSASPGYLHRQIPG